MLRSIRKDSILIVEDEHSTLQKAADYFYALGYRVRACHSGPEALNWAAKEDYDFVLTDYQMDPMNGLELVAHLKKQKPDYDPVFVVLSLHRSPELAEESRKLGIKLWMIKPFEGATLHAAFQRLKARYAEESTPFVA